MAHSKIILVTGATGQQGGAVARVLLRRGHHVRALTRDPKKAADLAGLGASVWAGDFSRPATVAAAMHGADAVFAVSTPFEAGLEAEVAQGIRLADLAWGEGVPHFVFTSVIGAMQNTGIPHFETKRRIERHIRSLALSYTILRPVWFMENFATWLLPDIKKGVLAAPLWPQTRLQMVALRDIGEFGADACLHPERYRSREIDLAGDSLTFPEVAQTLSRALGRPVTFEQIPDDMAQAAVGEDFAKMYRWFNEVGTHVDIPALERGYGLRPTRFADLAARMGSGAALPA